VIILGKPNTRCTDQHSYTLLSVLGNHYKAVQWFHLACNIALSQLAAFLGEVPNLSKVVAQVPN
jgi:hypothetical protein